MIELANKRVCVIGAARSGIAACKLLCERGAKVSITDSSDSQSVKENLALLDTSSLEKVEMGAHTKDLIKGRDLIVVSPGVPFNAQPLVWAREEGIKIISEIELAYRLSPAPVVAITGTNGKTTVTTLVGKILENAGKKPIVCGNIGTPFSGEISKIKSDNTVVLEVSSFQLETIESFRPKVAAILNITNDHLDRHKDFNEYLEAKCRIFENQTSEDWAVCSEENDDAFSLLKRTKAKGVYYDDIDPNPALAAKNFNHNYLAAIAISRLCGVSQDIAISTCQDFKGIEHRLEEVVQIQGITIINDSKATNVDSTQWALDRIEKPLVLIAGGRDKGSDFSLVRDAMKRKVKALIVLGEAKDKIQNAFSDIVKTKAVDSLSQALNEAYEMADSGDCILLSPMCASFDMFKNYKERGKVFKEEAMKLALNKTGNR
jgi:UDP-N-acetylmuramoylalanine--D-glutamate ligase